MNALWFIAYSLGNILGKLLVGPCNMYKGRYTNSFSPPGPQAFTSRDAPAYTGGFIGLLVSIGVATASISAYGILCKRENMSRDRSGLGADSQGDQNEAFTDMTDKEKPSFRYTY